MYGHALELLSKCSTPDCDRPGMIRQDDGRIICAADARALEEETQS